MASMCSACEGEEPVAYVPVERAVVLRAREIEASLPGERVPDSAWDIYFGFAGGAIAWPHFQRMRQSHDQAERSVAPAKPALGKRQARARLVCAEVG
jgi:hypothetical protein